MPPIQWSRIRAHADWGPGSRQGRSGQGRAGQGKAYYSAKILVRLGVIILGLNQPAQRPLSQSNAQPEVRTGLVRPSHATQWLNVGPSLNGTLSDLHHITGCQMLQRPGSIGGAPHWNPLIDVTLPSPMIEANLSPSSSASLTVAHYLNPSNIGGRRAKLKAECTAAARKACEQGARQAISFSSEHLAALRSACAGLPDRRYS